VCLIGVHLMGVYLMGVYLTGVYLTGVLCEPSEAPLGSASFFSFQNFATKDGFTIEIPNSSGPYASIRD
jgi:hypothetical protein